jgi:hypothetical protein
MLVLTHATPDPDSFLRFHPANSILRLSQTNAMRFGIMRRIRRLHTDVRLVSYWVTLLGREIGGIGGRGNMGQVEAFL